MDLKLTIEMLPSRVWRKNVRQALPRGVWNKIRERTFRIHGRKCSICGYEGKAIEVHESWEYDYDRGILRLTDFIPLCKRCHLVKHFGMAQVLHRKGKLDITTVIAHFMGVNGCSYREFAEHCGEAHFKALGNGLSRWRIEIKGQAREKPRGPEQLPLIFGGSSGRG